jgi:hypothetical protein
MDCCEFRERYSDFADGLLDEEAEVRARRHLSLCAPCRRFDAAFRMGVNALRDVPHVDVSRGFGERLGRRLRHELAVRSLAVNPAWGAVAAMLVMVTIGLVTWDLVELHAARRAASVAAASATKPLARAATAATARRDTLRILTEGFHPFDPVLLIADTNPVPDGSALRFDVPAVWGGR